VAVEPAGDGGFGAVEAEAVQAVANVLVDRPFTAVVTEPATAQGPRLVIAVSR
jgi:hypothetical protein